MMGGWDRGMFESEQVYSKNPHQVGAGRILKIAPVCEDIRYETDRRNDMEYTQMKCQTLES